VIIFLSITFRINNIWNRYHLLRMTNLIRVRRTG
jgi:hypothetical protein